MQFLLSCAKTMTEKSRKTSALNTVPLFKAEAKTSALILQQYTVEQLAMLFKCSNSIAVENKKRYWNFFDEDEYLQAIYAYTGVAYKSLNADDFTDEDLAYAQGHMWITSFLYGLLRPMDMIHAYRLEGAVKLHDGLSMFQFWRSRLTSALIDSVKKDDGILLHIATEEMTHLFDWKRIKTELHVVEPNFFVDDGKRLKIVTVYAKMCRGAMARFIIKNRCDSVEDLKAFEYEGFRFVEAKEEDGTDKLKFVLG